MSILAERKKQRKLPNQTVAEKTTMPVISFMKEVVKKNNGTLIIKLPDLFTSSGVLEEFLLRISIISRDEACNKIIFLSNSYGTSHRVIANQLPMHLACEVIFMVGQSPKSNMQTLNSHRILYKRIPTNGLVAKLELEKLCTVIRWQ